MFEYYFETDIILKSVFFEQMGGMFNQCYKFQRSSLRFPKCSEYAAQLLHLAVMNQITNYSNQNIVYIKIAGD